MPDIPSGGGGGGGATGWVRVRDVDPTNGGDVVDQKVFDTTGTILQSCRTSSNEVDITVAASFPEITIGAETFQLALSADGGHYAGTVSATLAAAGDITVVVTTPDGGVGARDTFTTTFNLPPQLLTLSFTGGYPGAPTQTELKAGDQFQVTGTTDKPIDAIFVQDSDAGTGQLISVPTGTSFTVAMTIADRGTAVQALPANIQARDAGSGSLGPVRATNQGGGTVDGVDLVFMTNFYFSLSYGAPIYPGGQQALKGAEAATLAITTDFAAGGSNSIAYTSPGGELSITNPNTDEGSKTVNRIGGTYNVTTNNLRCTLFRAANGATTVEDTLVQIADTAPIINVLTPASRLRSGGNDGTSAQNHTITIDSNQQLLNAPSLDADSGGSRGTFIGGGWGGGPEDWTRQLQVDDNDEKGTFSWENLVATNLAGVVVNTITGGTQYVLGGFVARSIAVPAFQSSVAFNVEVVDFSKLTADNFSPGGPSVKMPIGTVADTVNGYTIDAININPTTLELLDQAAIAANSLGLYTLLNLEETV